MKLAASYLQLRARRDKPANVVNLFFASFNNLCFSAHLPNIGARRFSD
jgi:hypothetical protein